MAFWRCLNEACATVWWKSKSPFCPRCGHEGEDATANAKNNGRPKPDPPKHR